MLKVNSLGNPFKFDGKILKKSGRKYNGMLYKDLSSGKRLGLTYKNGLLSHSSLSGGDEPLFKSYFYDDNNRLINIKQNNKDIFIKEIKHNLGLEYTREEIINGTVSRTFDSENRLLRYIISPKLLLGFIKYLDNLSIETRYFLNSAKYTGHGHIQLKYNFGDPVLNNGIIDKTIIKMKNGAHTVIKGDEHHLHGKYINPQGKTGPDIHYIMDKNSNSVRTQIIDPENKKLFDKKVQYDDLGNKQREIFSDFNGKYYTENLFNKKGNLKISRKLNKNFEIFQTVTYKYNDNNLITEEKIFNKNKKLVEKTNYTYYPDNKKKTVKTTYYDIFGSYDNISEFSKNGKIKKLTEIYNDTGRKYETYYDKHENDLKYIEKDSEDNVICIKEYINKEYEKIKTIVKNNENEEKYHIEHSHKIENDIMKDINVFKTPENNLLGKEFITHNNETEKTKIIYTDALGHRIDHEKLCAIVGDEL